MKNNISFTTIVCYSSGEKTIGYQGFPVAWEEGEKLSNWLYLIPKILKLKDSIKLKGFWYGENSWIDDDYLISPENTNQVLIAVEESLISVSEGIEFFTKVLRFAPKARKYLELESAAEIQQLLERISRTLPTKTATEQEVVAAEAIKQIESDPDLKQKVINAAKEGGLAAFEKALDNPIGALITGAIKGWLEAKAE